jgi:CheY-like chemotaxis protein
MTLKCAIFVVDDLLEEARSAQRFFESYGHEVTIETSGKKAIQILRGPSLFDVTFLDLLMPDVNGEQVYQALKIYAPARLKRLVFFTGMGYLAETWLRRTGVPIIEKGPNSPALLIATVEQFAQLSCTRGPREERGVAREIAKIEPQSFPAKSDLSVMSEFAGRLPHIDHAENRNMNPPHKPPSNPDLSALYDEDMEVDTDMIQLAAKKGVSSSFITELRIRYLHSNHKSLKEDVTEVKGAVAKVAADVTTTKTDLSTLKTEITTAIKTSFKWLSFIVLLIGGSGTAIGWLIEHFLLKK